MNTRCSEKFQDHLWLLWESARWLIKDVRHGHKGEVALGLPWWLSGEDSALSMQAAQGLIPGRGTRSHMPQLEVHMLQLLRPWVPQVKIPHAATKTQHNQSKKCLIYLKVTIKMKRLFFWLIKFTHCNILYAENLHIIAAGTHSRGRAWLSNQ